MLTPQGHLMLAPTDEVHILPDNLRDRLEAAFERLDDLVSLNA